MFKSICITLLLVSVVMAGNVGQWDSSIHNLIDHPKTAALRIEVIDSQTRLPIENAQITFKGSYYLESRNSRHPEGKREAQTKDYELTCKTDSDGIAIGAFGWQKDYPWQNGVDEIEKVQSIEVRHSKYSFKEVSAPFMSFLEVGQERSTSQRPAVFEKFERAWQAQCSEAVFCTLDIGKEFSDFGNKHCSRSDFFDKIRDKEWGIVYREPRNYFSKGEYPQSLCGPYFIYLIEIQMEKIKHCNR